jgi:hypothetical protein
LPFIFFVFLALGSWSLGFNFGGFKGNPVVNIILLVDLTLFLFLGSWPLSAFRALIVLQLRH